MPASVAWPLTPVETVAALGWFLSAPIIGGVAWYVSEGGREGDPDGVWCGGLVGVGSVAAAGVLLSLGAWASWLLATVAGCAVGLLVGLGVAGRVDLGWRQREDLSHITDSGLEELAATYRRNRSRIGRRGGNEWSGKLLAVEQEVARREEDRVKQADLHRLLDGPSGGV